LYIHEVYLLVTNAPPLELWFQLKALGRYPLKHSQTLRATIVISLGAVAFIIATSIPEGPYARLYRIRFRGLASPPSLAAIPSKLPCDLGHLSFKGITLSLRDDGRV